MANFLEGSSADLQRPKRIENMWGIENGEISESELDPMALFSVSLQRYERNSITHIFKSPERKGRVKSSASLP
jgi:hypothetical protein